VVVLTFFLATFSEKNGRLPLAVEDASVPSIGSEPVPL
jgi:hypothetical protein